MIQDKNMNTAIIDPWWSRFGRAPLILQAYLVFAMLASILSMSGFYTPPLERFLVPYTGWSALGFYRFTLLFAVAPIVTSNRVEEQTPRRQQANHYRDYLTRQRAAHRRTRIGVSNRRVTHQGVDAL